MKGANTLKNSGSKHVTNLTLADANKYRECGESRRWSSCIYSILITVVPKTRYVINITFKIKLFFFFSSSIFHYHELVKLELCQRSFSNGYECIVRAKGEATDHFIQSASPRKVNFKRI